MKKLLIVFMALMCTATLMAQRIAVVDANGNTSVYKTLEAAIKGAADGSVVYLPGGSFPIADSVKITKKLTIIGIGHKANNDNVDGITTISGNLFFNEGSSGSAVIGCYITGDVNLGPVNNILVRCCNLNRVYVNNINCKGTVVCQNYIRSSSIFSSTPGKFTNIVAHSVCDLDNGLIAYNLLFQYYDWDAIAYCDNCSIIGNIDWTGHGSESSTNNSSFYNNMGRGDQINTIHEINLSGIEWNDVFVNPVDFTPSSDFHFKGVYTKYNGICGIYAGDGFSDDQLAPVPFIVSKSIDQQTDASGKLNVKIRVKARE